MASPPGKKIDISLEAAGICRAGTGFAPPSGLAFPTLAMAAAAGYIVSTAARCFAVVLF
jgi:hypothetical protein